MLILGVETSCDETAVAVLEIKKDKIKVLSNAISSQVKLHAKYGGVVPNLAAREHVKNVGHVFRLSLKEAKIKNLEKKIDLIAVTHGPGLGPSLLVGIAFARTLAWKYNKPLIGVNHLEGHIYSNYLKPIREYSIFNFQFLKKESPILNLIVSGGHTELVLMTGHGKYKIIGETMDDAVGEAFDKVARLLGLGYPGGPRVAAAAARHAQTIADTTQTNTDKTSPSQSVSGQHQSVSISFPRPMINSKNYNFSYAGLKTAVLYKVRDLKNTGVKFTDSVINEVCYEFQKAALDVLVFKTIKAAKEYEVKSLFLSGGVSANQELRKRLAVEARKLKINYSQPEMEYTGDNAAMIAAAGYLNYESDKKMKTAYDAVEMDANLEL